VLTILKVEVTWPVPGSEDTQLGVLMDRDEFLVLGSLPGFVLAALRVAFKIATRCLYPDEIALQSALGWGMNWRLPRSDRIPLAQRLGAPGLQQRLYVVSPFLQQLLLQVDVGSCASIRQSRYYPNSSTLARVPIPSAPSFVGRSRRCGARRHCRSRPADW
jgi:hypothetical protein